MPTARRKGPGRAPPIVPGMFQGEGRANGGDHGSLFRRPCRRALGTALNERAAMLPHPLRSPTPSVCLTRHASHGPARPSYQAPIACVTRQVWAESAVVDALSTLEAREPFGNADSKLVPSSGAVRAYPDPAAGSHSPATHPICVRYGTFQSADVARRSGLHRLGHAPEPATRISRSTGRTGYPAPSGRPGRSGGQSWRIGRASVSWDAA
jgi:hypothetical protein